MWWSWLACVGSNEPGPVDGAPTGEPAAFAADLPIGGCGMPDYALVGPEGLGQIVSVDEASDLSLSLSTIRAILAIAGVPPERFDLRYDVETWRVRYTTQDRGQIVEATMLLSFPVSAGPVPTMMWGHGTTGFTDECAPSAMGIEGGALNLLFSAMGFAVASPDYLGMAGFGAPSSQLHPYLVPEPAALASLDAVRAAWAFEGAADLGSEATRQTVWAGGSEGGFTALWADRYAPHYLPEAEPIAVIASVPPADLPALADEAATTFSDASGGLVAALTTWGDWYGTISLDEVIVEPYATQLPGLLASTCGPDLDPEPTSVEEIFTAAFRAAVTSGTLADAFPEVACGLAKGDLAESAVPYRSDAPVLYVVSELDELVLAGPTRDAYGDLCAAGYTMNYIECAGADHTEGALWSLGQVLDWLTDRVDGVPLEGACTQPPAMTCDLQDVLQ